MKAQTIAVRLVAALLWIAALRGDVVLAGTAPNVLTLRGSVIAGGLSAVGNMTMGSLIGGMDVTTNPASSGPMILNPGEPAVTPSPPVINGSLSQSGMCNQPFSYTITASGSPASYSAVPLPTGLSCNPGSGIISGTPAQNGIFTVTISVVNGGGTGQATLTITIASGIESITGPPASFYRAGSPLNFTVAYCGSVTVAGTPEIMLNIGGVSHAANYVSGSPGTSLSFAYTPVSGDTGAIAITSPIVLPVGASITDGHGLAAGLVFTPPDLSGVVVDTTLPAIAITGPSVPITSNGPVTYGITYSDANFLQSTLDPPNITLANSAGNIGNASGTVSISGSYAQYTVSIINLTGNGPLGISLAAGTALDRAGNPAPAAGPSTPFIVDNLDTTLTAATDSVTGTVITINGVPGVTYRLQWTTDLGTAAWQDLASVKTDAAGVGTYGIGFPTDSRHFYRAVLP